MFNMKLFFATKYKTLLLWSNIWCILAVAMATTEFEYIIIVFIQKGLTEKKKNTSLDYICEKELANKTKMKLYTSFYDAAYPRFNQLIGKGVSWITDCPLKRS